MRFLLLPTAVLSLFAISTAGAIDTDRTKLAEKLVTAMRVENLLRNGAPIPLPVDAPVDRPDPATFSKTVWQKLKPDYVKAYAEVYTEGELRALITFYQSPIGQSYLDKTPELARRIVAAHQKLPLEPSKSK